MPLHSELAAVAAGATHVKKPVEDEEVEEGDFLGAVLRQRQQGLEGSSAGAGLDERAKQQQRVSGGPSHSRAWSAGTQQTASTAALSERCWGDDGDEEDEEAGRRRGEAAAAGGRSVCCSSTEAARGPGGSEEEEEGGGSSVLALSEMLLEEAGEGADVEMMEMMSDEAGAHATPTAETWGLVDSPRKRALALARRVLLRVVALAALCGVVLLVVRLYRRRPGDWGGGGEEG